MHNQHKQYVILTIVLLACGASIFFGVRNIVRSTDEVTTFAVGDWEGITLPRYKGPAIYTTSAPQTPVVSLPAVSSSSRALFHHHVATYRAETKATNMPQTNYTARRLYQTSDHVVHSVGAGSGVSGATPLGTSSYQNTSTASYSSAITIPSARTYTQTLALNNINMAASSSSLANDGIATIIHRNSRVRKIAPSDEGLGEDDYGKIEEKDGETWFWDGEQWINQTPIGATKIVDGKVYEWDGSGWVFKGDQAEPDTPVGDIPWLMILFAAAAFGVCKVVKKKENR